MEYFSTIAFNLHCEVEANTDNFATTTAKSRLWKGLASDHFSDMSKKYDQGCDIWTYLDRLSSSNLYMIILFSIDMTCIIL